MINNKDGTVTLTEPDDAIALITAIATTVTTGLPLSSMGPHDIAFSCYAMGIESALALARKAPEWFAALAELAMKSKTATTVMADIIVSGYPQRVHIELGGGKEDENARH